MGASSDFNPATMAMEAHCEDCGALVATMAREAQVAHPFPSLAWFSIHWAGMQNHREVGCDVS